LIAGPEHDLKLLSSFAFSTMLIYQPTDEPVRIAWYGGESTQLHFEMQNSLGEWKQFAIQTLGNGIPDSVKDMLLAMSLFYNECHCTPTNSL